ncbi:hypothetical protein HOY34_08905 [Xinfangfangia sp. D13-10-4-6]|uniref:hypothetical protein n=1 Tax=Pseudogemmobacter hezensis TaxID=2737662 RepID=UPI00155258D1|nr:hypothetical protein [Pseudogemmobacter hezensis]NPD15316.1 hypothetical protein [Pseudogemmobacter hezensis]
MSDSSSFIDEVTEELRRERFTKAFRRWGWLGGVLIVGIVAGTAWTQYAKSRDAGIAQNFGDALIEAMDTGSPEARREALAAVPAQGQQLVIRELIAASDPAEDRVATLAALDQVIADTALAPVWRDLAILRRAIVAGPDTPLAERRSALGGIAVAGRPYRALAAEQLAYLLIEEGKIPEAIAALNQLATEQDASGPLRARSGQIVVALGGKPAEIITDIAPAAPAPGPDAEQE